MKGHPERTRAQKLEVRRSGVEGVGPRAQDWGAEDLAHGGLNTG